MPQLLDRWKLASCTGSRWMSKNGPENRYRPEGTLGVGHFKIYPISSTEERSPYKRLKIGSTPAEGSSLLGAMKKFFVRQYLCNNKECDNGEHVIQVTQSTDEKKHQCSWCGDECEFVKTSLEFESNETNLR